MRFLTTFYWYVAISILSGMPISFADEKPNKPTETELARLETLTTLYDVRNSLRGEIKIIGRKLKHSPTDANKVKIHTHLNQLSTQLTNIENNIEQISTGLSSPYNEIKVTKKFNLKDDIAGLLKPLFNEMKHATSDIRKKSRLREEINFYTEQSSQARQATENLGRLEETSKPALKKNLSELHNRWKRRLKQAKSNLKASTLQLESIEKEESKEDFFDNSQAYLKGFFKKRGLYLFLGFMGVVFVLLSARLLYKYVLSHWLNREGKSRTFRQRLAELFFRVATVIFAIITPMIVFYYAEDWVLFSLGVLLLFGLAWTLKYTIPRMWQQVLLMLNIGPVREGERIVYNDLPWQVRRLNVYTELYNPTAGFTLRVPLEKMVGKVSRPINGNEPWFPCKQDDWVILSDGVRGKVVGLAHELVELVERGGSHVTYRMDDFLGLSPRNLSTSFRIKETIGISYDLQQESTGSILRTLDTFIHDQINNEGYSDDIMSLRVEFENASASSLDIVVIADFKGSQAPIYNRLRRAIQRWCVDACTANHWEIPFAQMVIHQEAEED
ncbi:MAG: hypothetical protein KAH22_06170 [Thiotrichaceae bacterium]|nr:hypothetical protein [Thiotrichaceae bacterium]